MDSTYFSLDSIKAAISRGEDPFFVCFNSTALQGHIREALFCIASSGYIPYTTRLDISGDREYKFYREDIYSLKSSERYEVETNLKVLDDLAREDSRQERERKNKKQSEINSLKDIVRQQEQIINEQTARIDELLEVINSLVKDPNSIGNRTI